MKADKIAEAFVAYYYNVLDKGNRHKLGNLYRENAQLTWDGFTHKGVHNIIAFLENAPAMRHTRETTTVHATPGDDRICIVVTGTVVIHWENLYAFTERFEMMPKITEFGYEISKQVFNKRAIEEDEMRDFQGVSHQTLELDSLKRHHYRFGYSYPDAQVS
ncbi:NTF2-like protein [Clavulina sp. PMI_390]|nr:NTF2-like protein [Clavulina sp. PMI_390]